MSLLIYFNSRVNLLDKPQTSEESNRACEHKEREGHHAHVAEVQDCWHKSRDIELCKEVPHGV